MQANSAGRLGAGALVPLQSSFFVSSSAKILIAMSTDLTLTLDSQVVEQAQAYDQATGRISNEWIEMMLKANTSPAATAPTLSPAVQALFGSLKLPDDFDYKESLTKALLERYGK